MAFNIFPAAIFLAGCIAAIRADIDLSHQPVDCTPEGKTPILNIKNLYITKLSKDVHSLAGSLTIMHKLTSNTSVTVRVEEYSNMAGKSTYHLNQDKSFCEALADLTESMAPQSNFMRTVAGSQRTCPLDKGERDMTNVTLNQAQLKDLEKGTTYEFFIKVTDEKRESCIEIHGVHVNDT